MNGDLHGLMNQFVGTWQTEGRIVDGGEHDGEEWSGYDIYEWFPGERQMVHRVDVHILGGRKEAMELFTPRERSPDTFDQVAFDADGTVEKSVGSFDADGRYHSDTEEIRATLTFERSNLLRAKWEMRRPDGAWTDWMNVTFTRVADPHIEVRSKSDHAS